MFPPHRHDDLKEMLDSNKDSLKLEAMKRIVAVSGINVDFGILQISKYMCVMQKKKSAVSLLEVDATKISLIYRYHTCVGSILDTLASDSLLKFVIYFRIVVSQFYFKKDFVSICSLILIVLHVIYL